MYIENVTVDLFQNGAIMKNVKEYLKDLLKEKLRTSDKKMRAVVSVMHVEKMKYCDREMWKFAVECIESDNLEDNLKVIAYYAGEALFYIAADEMEVQEKAAEYKEYRERFAKEREHMYETVAGEFLRAYTKNFNKDKEFKMIGWFKEYFNQLEKESRYINPKYFIELMNELRKGEANNTFSWKEVIKDEPKHLMWKLLCLKCDVPYEEILEKYNDQMFVNDGLSFNYSVMNDALCRLVIFCYTVLKNAEGEHKEYFETCIKNAKRVLVKFKIG